MKNTLVDTLALAYHQVQIGDPLQPETLMGPLIDVNAVEQMEKALKELQTLGGKIFYGGKRLDLPGGLYVTPCLTEAQNEWPVVQRETFAPILYILPFKEFDEALRINNNIPQGLSSATFPRTFMRPSYFSFLSEAIAALRM